MRAVVQRTLRSAVTSEGHECGRAGHGLTVLLGVGSDDTKDDVVYMAEKIMNLRIFEDDAGKMNRSLLDMGGDMLVVSQFTLYGDARRGRRPGFTGRHRRKWRRASTTTSLPLSGLGASPSVRAYFARKWSSPWTTTALLLFYWTVRKYFRRLPDGCAI